MLGARSPLLSFQATKENLIRLLHGSTPCRYETIIVCLERLGLGDKLKCSYETEAERRWSGSQATFSGAGIDQLDNQVDNQGVACGPMHFREGDISGGHLHFHSGRLGSSEVLRNRMMLARGEVSLGCRMNGRPTPTLQQKASFATEAHQPVPSPLQMLPSPVRPQDDIPDPEAESKRAQCVAKGLPMSPYKLNLVAKMVRGMSVQEALDQLEASPKRAAIPVYKAIHSARANAGHSQSMDTERLVIEKCFVGHGQHLRRLSYHAKGRSGVKKRRRAHLTVILRELELPKAEKLKEIEAKKFHPTQLRWVNRPKRARTWIEELTARALEKKKEAVNRIASSATT